MTTSTRTQNGPGLGGCSTIDKVKALITIPDLWKRMGIPGDPHRTCKSPFREERSPSFSVYSNGTRFKDFGSGEGGDVIDFWLLASGENLTPPQAAEKMLADFGGGLDMNARIEPRKRHVTLKVDFSAPSPVQGRVDPVVLNFLLKRGTGQDVIDQVYHEGSINSIDGNIAFNYCGGNVKVRYQDKDSHSCRWWRGGAGATLWRGHTLTDPRIKRVILMEGETDCVAMMGEVGLDRMERDGIAVIAAPQASFRMNEIIAGIVGRGRRVIVCFDSDGAGIQGMGANCLALEKHGQCASVDAVFPSLNGNDFSDLDRKKRKKVVDLMCSLLYK